MKFFKLLLLSFTIVFIFFACRKKDCPKSDPVKTDALSNKAWKGAYGRNRLLRPDDSSPTDVYDTIFILSMKNNGFFEVYKSIDTAQVGVAGKGYYTFDGTDFNATFSFFQIGRPYVLKGKVNELGQLIIGKMSYSESETNGVFQIIIAQSFQ